MLFSVAAAPPEFSFVVGGCDAGYMSVTLRLLLLVANNSTRLAMPLKSTSLSLQNVFLLGVKLSAIVSFPIESISSL